MDGEGRPLRSQRQVDFCDLWRLGFESDVSMEGEGDFSGLYCSMLACSVDVCVLTSLRLSLVFVFQGNRCLPCIIGSGGLFKKTGRC